MVWTSSFLKKHAEQRHKQYLKIIKKGKRKKEKIMILNVKLSAAGKYLDVFCPDNQYGYIRVKEKQTKGCI